MPVVPRDHGNAIEVHKGAYVAATDPGAVGADKLWVQRTGIAPYAIHVRKADNTGWEAAGGSGVDATAFHKGGDASGATLVFGSTDNHDLSFIAGGSEWSHFYWAAPIAAGSWDVFIPVFVGNTLPASGQMVAAQIDVNEAGGYSGPSSAFFGSTTLYTPTGTLDGLDAGVWGQARLAPGTALAGPLLSGVVGYVEHDGNGALGIAASFYAKPVVFGGGGGSIGKAIGLYAPAQSAGAENWSAYFGGAVKVASGGFEVDMTDPSYGQAIAFFANVNGTAAGQSGAALSGTLAFVGASGTVVESYAVDGTVLLYGGAPASVLAALHGAIAQQGTGILSEARVVQADAVSHTGTGSVTRAVGVYAAAQTVGTSKNYSVFADGDINTQTMYKVNDVKVVGAQQTHVADVASADAPAQTAAYVQADVQAIATLCNELKTKLDAALAVLSAHGLMA